MSVDQTVEAAMEAQFWDIFSVGVGGSKNMSNHDANSVNGNDNDDDDDDNDNDR